MSPSNPRAKRGVVIACLLALYAGIAVLTTYPLSMHLSTHLPGNSDDTILHFWNGWWVQYALQERLNVLHSQALFYPNGLSLVTHNIAWFNALPYALLEPLIGGIAAFNVCTLINLVACGLAAAILVHDLTDSWAPAALAGLIYQAWPYRMHQLTHPNLASTQFIPLFLMFLMRTLRKRRWRDALLTGLTFALVGYGRWQLLIPATIMGCVCTLSLWREWAPRANWHALGQILVAGAIATALLAPPFYLLYQQQTSESAADLMREGEEETMQTDVLSYITPGEWHWLLSDLTEPLYESYYADHLASKRYYPAYLGVVAVLLAIVSLVMRPRQSWPWLTVAGLMVALALGPVLRLNGQLFPQVPMPYRLLARTEVIRLMRRPERYNMFIALPMAVLAAWGTDALLAKRRSHLCPRQWIVLASLGSLALVEYLSAPVPIEPVEMGSPYLAEMAQDTDYTAVLNLPFDDLKSKTYMWEQITHGKKIVQGNVSRMPGNAYDYIQSIPLLASLYEHNEIDPALTDISAQLDMLAADGIGRILIHKDLVGEDRVEHWQRYLVMAPVYEDDTLLVYDTSPDLGQEIERSRQVVEGLGIAESVIGATRASPGRPVEVDIAWASDRALDSTYAVSLRLIDHDGNLWADMRYPLCREYAHAAMPQDRLIWSYYVLFLPNYIAPDDYAIAIAVIDPMTGQYGEEHILQDIVVEAAPSSPQAAVYGRLLSLDRADLRQDGQRVVCRLEWTAMHRMRIDYTVFVHVFDQDTGVPVAQDDSMPRRGAYPTRFWWPGELVDDQFEILLDAATPGTYGLCVGVYDAATGERLPGVDGSGQEMDDGRLVVQETVVIPATE